MNYNDSHVNDKDVDMGENDDTPMPTSDKLDDSKESIAPYVVAKAGTIHVTDILDPALIEKELRERENYVRKQELVQASEANSHPQDFMRILIREISEELSHLKFERRKASKEGKNTSSYTIARIASLRQLSDILLKRQENARSEQLDLKSPRFREIFKLWMNFFYESMEKCGVKDEIRELVFKQMEADMHDYEIKVINSDVR